MTVRSRLAGALLALALPVAALASEASPRTDLDSRLAAAEAWLETQLAHDNVTGASVAIVHDQRTVWTRGFGYSNREARVPATPQTRYSICSISKLFTSMAAMRERDAGRLDIDAPVAAILPWYGLRDVASPDGPVTARGIMSHVAGLPRESDSPYWEQARFPDIEAVRARLSEQAGLYRAYDAQQYSNLGMTLLGEMVAAASGEDYHAYVRTHFLGPIGLADTTSELPVELHGRAFAVGYTARRGGWEREAFPAYRLNALAAAAGFASTAEDLGRFASWQFRLLGEGGESVLRSSTLREMQRVHWMSPDAPDETWGLGFATYMHDGKSFVGHGGYCPGYRSTLMMRPQDRVAIVVLANVDEANTARLARELYDFVGADLARATRAAAGGADADAPTARTADFSALEGRYGRPRSANDIYVGQAGDDLFTVDLYADTRAARDAVRWRHVEGTLFRRIRADDSLGEEMRFDLDETGRASRVWRHSNPMQRM